MYNIGDIIELIIPVDPYDNECSHFFYLKLRKFLIAGLDERSGVYTLLNLENGQHYKISEIEDTSWRKIG